MAVFEGGGDVAVGIHKELGEGIYDGGPAAAVGANKGDVLAAAVGEDVDNLADNLGVVGLLQMCASAGVAFG